MELLEDVESAHCLSLWLRIRGPSGRLPDLAPRRQFAFPRAVLEACVEQQLSQFDAAVAMHNDITGGADLIGLKAGMVLDCYGGGFGGTADIVC